MKDLAKLFKQAQQMQQKLLEMQEKLAHKTAEASSGGGMVTVVMNGKYEIVSLKIDPEVVNPADVEMLEDLVIAAINECRSRVEEMVKNEMSSLAGGFPVPGMF